MFRLDINDDVNINTKATVEGLVWSVLTSNLCKHILLFIVCLHIIWKPSQGEHARSLLKTELNNLP